MAGDERNRTDRSELADHFEAIIGREISQAELTELVLRTATGLYSDESGWRTVRTYSPGGLPPRKACEREEEIETFGGIVATGQNGKAQFQLSDFHCIVDFHPGRPIISVATAHTHNPVFVTMVDTPAQNDVKIEIYAWDADGNPAANVPIRWLCRVPQTTTVE